LSFTHCEKEPMYYCWECYQYDQTNDTAKVQGPFDECNHTIEFMKYFQESMSYNKGDTIIRTWRCTIKNQ